MYHIHSLYCVWCLNAGHLIDSSVVSLPLHLKYSHDEGTLSSAMPLSHHTVVDRHAKSGASATDLSAKSI